jgi:tetratricopeptide (TPR) repeat protein
MLLPDPRRSRVVLIGTSEYADSKLPDIPAIETTINILGSTLADLDYAQAPGDSQHCVTLLNETNLPEVGRQLGAAADEAEDLLFVYYTGRGLRDNRTGSLYLSLPDSDPKRPGFSSLEYADLRDAVMDSEAAMKVVVLDVRFPCDIGDLGDQLDVKGGYVIVSPFGEDAELARARDMHTAFSSHLNSVLRDGVPGGPGLLRVDDIYSHILKRMRHDGLPQPEARGTYADGHLALIRNRGSHFIPNPLTTTSPLVIKQSPRTPEHSDNAGGQDESAPGEERVRWFNEWMLDWLAGAADRLTENVSDVAATLLARAAASVEPKSERYAWFASRLAQALLRTGELTQAQDFVNLALDCADDIDVRVHLYSTLAQCLDKAGSPFDAISVLGRALGSRRLTDRHRAGLLVLAARSHANLDEFSKASKIASDALKAATDAGDESAADWALHIISMSTAMAAAKSDFAGGGNRDQQAKNRLVDADPTSSPHS